MNYLETAVYMSRMRAHSRLHAYILRSLFACMFAALLSSPRSPIASPKRLRGVGVSASARVWEWTRQKRDLKHT